MSLKGKVAVVTGAARGIGRGIALALAAQGAKVAFNYRSASSASSASSLCSEIENIGSQALAIQKDITDLDAPDFMIAQTLSAFQTSTTDILVNNAGLDQNTPLEDITLEEYDGLMTTNVRALLFMTQALLPYFPSASTGGGGRIVNLSSISARGGYATQTVYAASKAAVEGMTRIWAKELGQKYGVTVNCVNPGPVDTDMYRAAGETHLARMEEENKQTPAAPRAGTPGDVGHIVCWLCEERARWVTGDTICANGGMLFT